MDQRQEREGEREVESHGDRIPAEGAADTKVRLWRVGRGVGGLEELREDLCSYSLEPVGPDAEAETGRRTIREAAWIRGTMAGFAVTALGSPGSILLWNQR